GGDLPVPVDAVGCGSGTGVPAGAEDLDERRQCVLADVRHEVPVRGYSRTRKLQKRLHAPDERGRAAQTRRAVTSVGVELPYMRPSALSGTPSATSRRTA